MYSVQALRSAGYRVRVRHERLFGEVRRKKAATNLFTVFEAKNKIAGIFTMKELQTKGGRTVVSILTPKGLEREALAVCSLKEGFNRKTGLTKALGRAIALITAEEQEIDLTPKPCAVAK